MNPPGTYLHELTSRRYAEPAGADGANGGLLRLLSDIELQEGNRRCGKCNEH